ncbi:MAG: hypothetical protein GY820_30360 [Gammaproteobacteria bacterium]|nr:hypothetical protein [Gammaproteobacteria bacterium]
MLRQTDVNFALFSNNRRCRVWAVLSQSSSTFVQTSVDNQRRSRLTFLAIDQSQFEQDDADGGEKKPNFFHWALVTRYMVFLAFTIETSNKSRIINPMVLKFHTNILHVTMMILKLSSISVQFCAFGGIFQKAYIFRSFHRIYEG